MASSETTSEQSGSYTRGYYVIWSLLSLGAIIYISFLAFGSGNSSILKISKVEDSKDFSIKFKQQERQISSAIAIATGARAVGKNNGVRIDALEKRMQLLAWKQDDLKLLVEAPKDNAALSSDGQVKQVMGRNMEQVAESEDSSSDSVDSFQGAVAHAIKQVNSARNQLGAANMASQVANAVVGGAPQGGSDIIGTTVDNLGSLNPVTAAAVTAGLAQGAAAVTDTGIGTAGSIVSAVTGTGTGTTGSIATAVGATAVGAAAIGAAAVGAASQITPKAGKKVAVASFHRSLPTTKPDTKAAVKLAALKAPVKALPVRKAKPRIAKVPLPVRKPYALKLNSGRSVESLRLTWDLLSEMNRPMLGKLKTRYIKSAGQVLSPYRLIAGPLRTSSNAQQICAKLHKQNINCAVTVFAGRRL